MKKLTTLCLIFLTTICFKISGQISLEHAYGTYQSAFWLTDIGNDDYKYVIMDSSGFSLYNLDHSPYLLHVVPPIPLWHDPNYYFVSYITNSLFDCESSTLEYVISSNSSANGFYVYRTDGTLLFSRSDATGPYCYGCNGGAVVIRPIENTPSGTKLFLFDGDSTWVYSLCASLPLIVDDHVMKASYVKVFPNPTSGIINFEVNPPNNQEKFKLTVYNSLFEVIEETDVIEKNYLLDLKSRSFSSGAYLFDLRTDKKVFQTGKFLFTK